MAKTTKSTLQVPLIDRQSVEFPIIGLTGLYLHAMGIKARRVLLTGGQKKTAAEKLKLKHHPVEEFRSSMYLDTAGRFEDSFLMFPAAGIKRAIRSAALETEGVKATQVDRLLFVENEYVPIYGLPMLRMDVTRSSDIGRTPDVRTRAYLPAWATTVRISFAHPHLNQSAVAAMLANAGLFVGIGDFRQEKGRGNYGTFRTGTPQEVAKLRAHGRGAQEAAVQNPTIDRDHADTGALYDYWVEEHQRRG